MGHRSEPLRRCVPLTTPQRKTSGGTRNRPKLTVPFAWRFVPVPRHSQLLPRAHSGRQRCVAQCHCRHHRAGRLHPLQRLPGHRGAHVLGERRVGRDHDAVRRDRGAVPGRPGLPEPHQLAVDAGWSHGDGHLCPRLLVQRRRRADPRVPRPRHGHLGDRRDERLRCRYVDRSSRVHVASPTSCGSLRGAARMHCANAATGGSGNSRITSVTFTEVAANSITLAWTAAASATKYNIYYTTDGAVFSRVPPPAGSRTRPWPDSLQLDLPTLIR